jgi:hypothetical protein
MRYPSGRLKGKEPIDHLVSQRGRRIGPCLAGSPSVLFALAYVLLRRLVRLVAGTSNQLNGDLELVVEGSETPVTFTQQPNHRSWHPKEQPLGTGRSTLRRPSASLRRPRGSRGNEPVAGRDHRR